MKEKKKHQVIVGAEVMLLCMIIGVIGTNAASITPPSNQVSYNKNSQTTVQSAVNDLYTKLSYGDATSNEIVSGKTALVGGKQVVGTYTCPSVASQTPGDATPEDIAEGKIAWVNGNKIVGTRTTLENKVKLGDYISYTPSITSYTIPKEDTYYSSNQIINPSELNLWVVIQKNEDGTVDLVSEYLSSQMVYFGGKENALGSRYAYESYIQTLNKIAKAYETNGITVSSRNIGYDSTKVQEKVTIEYPFSSGVFTDKGYIKDLNLLYKAQDLLEMTCSTEHGGVCDYWLASRGSEFAGRYINNMGRLGQESLAEYGGHGRGIRPVVVLKSTLKITGGDGTKSSPYTIGT